MSSILERIARSAEADRPLVWCTADGSYHTVSPRTLFTEAQMCATNLLDRGLSPGRIVALMLPQGIDLIRAWLGCLIAGTIPTILPPPNDRQPVSLWLVNLLHVVTYTRAQALVYAPELRARLLDELQPGDIPTLLLDTAGIFTRTSFHALPSSPPDQVVLLQHSSGTTGLQKGVALTNRSISTQIDLYRAALRLDPRQDRIVSWLPLYHDMGLVACLLMPLITGCELIFMDNFGWAVQPTLLLEAITRRRATLCWMPNFAFNFLAARVPEEAKDDLDLRSVRLWINCSEPVKIESFQRFAAAFSRQGVSRSSLASCYAMAENTFAVTQSLPGLLPQTVPFSPEHKRLVLDGEDPGGASISSLVSSGSPLPGHRLRIVDDSGGEMPEGHMGEIQIASPCLMQGYFEQPEKTRQVLRQGWYSTGDLGIFHGGELFVCGRQKDLIILSGKNIFPEDVEDIVSRIPPVQPGRTVAFGLFEGDSGTEQLIVLAEYRPDTPSTRSQQRRAQRAIKKAINDQLGVSAREVHLLSPRTLLKSSSGKISRSRCRQFYETRLQPQPETHQNSP